MERGDILRGRKTYHPIIFLETIDDDQFKGCVLTHLKNHSDNFPFQVSHFLEKDTAGNDFKVKFDSSYFVKLVFIKKKEWGPFVKVGQLTQEGLSFIYDQTNGKNPVYWDDYVKV